MNQISFSDLNITCMDCKKIFVFNAGEQAFFASKALSPPKRCPVCRKQRKLTIVPDINSLTNRTSCQPIAAEVAEMNLEKRIEKIEEKLIINRGCVLLITVWDGSKGPTKEQSDQFLEHQRESGQCQNCVGICVLDWTANPPEIWRQQSFKGHRGLPVEDNKQHDWSFVIGKGYQESGN